MTRDNETIRVLIPLKLRKKNGRPKIMPPADYSPSEDQTQDPHILRAIGRAWGWRRRMEAGEFATIQELAEAVGLAERHLSRQLRLSSLKSMGVLNPSRRERGAGGKRRWAFGDRSRAVSQSPKGGWSLQTPLAHKEKGPARDLFSGLQGASGGGNATDIEPSPV